MASGFKLEIALSKHSKRTLPNADALTMYGTITDGDEPLMNHLMILVTMRLVTRETLR